MLIRYQTIRMYFYTTMIVKDYMIKKLRLRIFFHGHI
jgi:hypothetical protein